ncbi:MAG TPA: SRPBCC family protein [Chryseosolibacter sp.]
MSQNEFIPDRISKTASFLVDGKLEDVFPLFGPIKEKLWAEGWEPEVIFSNGELVQEHMIFRTQVSSPENYYTWIVTQFNPEQHLVEYTVTTQNRIWFIRVKCTAENTRTKATVTYTYTGLNKQGNDLNRNALERMYSSDLKDWQDAINYYLRHGRMLTSN